MGTKILPVQSDTPESTQPPPTITPPPATETPLSTQMLEEEAGVYKGCVLFIFGAGFDFRHYEGTRKSLERAGYKVQVASNTLEPIEGNLVVHGFENTSRNGQDTPFVIADLLLIEVQVSDYKAIVLISDAGMPKDQAFEVQSIVLQAAGEGLVLAAQEFGIYLLAGAGLLVGKKITANPLICKEMEVNYSAICTFMPVQRDGGIVTADPTMSTGSFARAILAEIENE